MDAIANQTAQDEGASRRIGVAALARVAFSGESLDPFRDELIDAIREGRASTGALMDLSAILQMQGAAEEGLALQQRALAFSRHYSTAPEPAAPSLKVLALAADVEAGANMPIDFLLSGSDIALETLYFSTDARMPLSVPEYDIAIVVAPSGLESSAQMREINVKPPSLSGPLLNLPQLISALERDRLPRLLRGAPGVQAPGTVRLYREELASVAKGRTDITDLQAEPLIYPLVIRPFGSQAGRGLEKIESQEDVADYLERMPGRSFFVSQFVDFSNEDGLFRKQRIAFVEGKPFPVHLAIGDRWDLWYANSGMETHASRREEEAAFFAGFDADFVTRHARALEEIAVRAGLDYFGVDCAETRDGDLLIFEADNAMIVHDMDSPETYPYKAAPFRAIADAFQAMMLRRVAADADAVANEAINAA